MEGSDLNLFAEQCVLGAALLERSDAASIVNDLGDEMFSDGFHRELFAAISDAYWAGETADPVTLSHRFPDRREYLVQLAEIASVNRHLNDYIRVVQEDWQLGALEASLLAVQAGGGSVASQLEKLEDLLGQHRRLLESRTSKGADSFAAAFGQFVKWLGERERPSVKTGFSRLDEATGGLMPGTVSTLAARPGGGKTDFALNLAMKAARDGARVLYFSMEMTTLQLMQRVASRLMHINGVRVRDRSLSPQEQEGVRRLTEQIRQMDRLSFLDEAQVSPARVQHYVGLYRPDLVIVDHIGLMKRPDMRDQYKALGLVSNALKQLALKEKLAVVQLAQMNRQVESRKGGKPNLSDLRESGDLEQDSDLVGFLSPQLADGTELYGQDAADVILYLEKNRHGRTGRMKFKWRPQYHEYWEVDQRTAGPDPPPFQQ